VEHHHQFHCYNLIPSYEDESMMVLIVVIGIITTKNVVSAFGVTSYNIYCVVQ
jgi:hypothetical protein